MSATWREHGRGVQIVEDEALVELQTRLLHQEHTITVLNDALTDQQAQISTLERRLQALHERVLELADGAPAGAPGDERPPHY